MHDLDRFFSPQTVAMIGVPEDKTRGGYALFKKVRTRLEPRGGRVYAVNPRLDEVDGMTCHDSVLDIPEDEIDLAIIMIGNVEAALRDCAQKNVNYALIFTAGFSEVGDAGAEREAEIARIAEEGGVKIFGPNTNANAFEDFEDLPGKKVALITQSGHQGRPVVQAEELGIGFKHWAPTGNEVHLEAADFIDYFAQLDDVGAIAMYVEGFKDGAKTRRALDLAARERVPVVCVKVGLSDAGAQMAQAHTGHLTGEDRVVDAVFDRYGVIRCQDLDEVTEIAGLFTLAPEPRGTGTCIYAISGGTGAHVADLFGAAGIPMPELEAETQQRLREWIPDYLKVSNPVDNGAQVIKQGANPHIMKTMLEDPNVDILVIPITGVLESISIPLCTDIADFNETSDKPIIVFWGSPLTDEGYDILRERRVPVVRSARNGTFATQAFLDWYRFAREYRAEADLEADPIDTSTYAVTPGPMSEHASREVLEAVGVPQVPERLCATPDAAAEAAAEIGYPVVVKVVSEQIPHKSDAGLVALDLHDFNDVHMATNAILERARAAFPNASIDGVTVQKMIGDGVEVLVGMSRDATFGPVIAVGLGGIFTEILDDVALGLPPLDAAGVEAMLAKLKAAPLLEGARGSKPVDRQALIDAVLAVSHLAADDRIAELDVNPLLATPDGAWAADALVVGR